MQFDSVRFLNDQFQTPVGLMHFLTTYKVRGVPKMNTLYRWWQRENVPGQWIAILLAYLEMEHGAPVSVQKYLRR
jgi:hypothetical protein